jgi:uncharacterized protein (TIGR02996 family)
VRTHSGEELSESTDFVGVVRRAIAGRTQLVAPPSGFDSSPLVCGGALELRKLLGAPLIERLDLAVAALLTDDEPQVRAEALLFFVDTPSASGGERVVALAEGDRAHFAGVIVGGRDLEDWLVDAVAWRIARLGETASIELARKEALRPGRARRVLWALAAHDAAWVEANAHAICAASPGDEDELLRLLAGAGRDVASLRRRLSGAVDERAEAAEALKTKAEALRGRTQAPLVSCARALRAAGGELERAYAMLSVELANPDLDAEERRLLLEVITRPEDDTPRLATAERLEARGESERAAFIRGQCRDPDGYAPPSAAQSAAWARMPAWAEPSFRRGFVELVAVHDVSALLSDRRSVFWRAPVTTLVIHGSFSERLAELSELRRVQTLRVVGGFAGPYWCEQLLGSDSISGLQELVLRECNLEPSGLTAILSCTQLTRLRALAVPSNRLAGLALERVAVPPSLAALSLDMNALEPDDAGALSCWDGLAQLERLSLGGNRLGSSGMALLLRRPLPQLRALELRRTELCPAGLDTIVSRAGDLPRLTELDLSECELDDAALAQLVESPLADRLERLVLSDNQVGDRAAAAIAASALAKTLRALDVRKTSITRAGRDILAQALGPALVSDPRGELAKARAVPRRPKRREDGIAYWLARREQLFAEGRSPSESAAFHLDVGVERVVDRALEPGAHDGWLGGGAPGVSADEWPRGNDGRPMRHILSLRVPEAYRPKRKKQHAAIAFFQEQPSERAAPPTPKKRRRTRWEHFEDCTARGYALLWLTEDEWARSPCEPPVAGRDAEPIWLVPVRDPNAHRAPIAAAELGTSLDELGVHVANGGYVPRELLEDLARLPQGTKAAMREFPRWDGEPHVGGTSYAYQHVPRWLSARYIELDHGDGGIELGGGNGQLDLETSRFDFTCP